MSKNIVQGDLPIHHIRVASQPTKAVRYGNGVNPFGMNAPTPTGVLGPTTSQPAPMHSSPAAGPRPHPDLITKVSEAEYAEATIGDKPHGTLSR
jgi:hypothetical protein